MAGDAYFSLTCSSDGEKIETRIKEIYTNGNKESPYPFQDCNSCKWHEMEKQCKAVSIEFPNVLITIDKKENDINTWENPFSRHHFKNGKYHCQSSQILWQDFNQNMLK